MAILPQKETTLNFLTLRVSLYVFVKTTLSTTLTINTVQILTCLQWVSKKQLESKLVFLTIGTEIEIELDKPNLLPDETFPDDQLRPVRKQDWQNFDAATGNFHWSSKPVGLKFQANVRIISFAAAWPSSV